MPATRSTEQVELSLRTQAILATVDDASLQQDVETSVRLSIEALSALRRIHLPQDQMEEGGSGELGDDKHLDLAPYVLSAISAMNRLLEHLATAFPAPADAMEQEQSADDFDLEFDLVDGPTGEGARLAGKPAAPTSKSKRDQVNETAYALGGMLRSRVLSVVPRLRYALSQNDPWALLAELDHYQHALSKSAQGLLFGFLAIFNDAVRREEILPEYRSAVREAVDLRAAITELAYHMSRCNAAIASAAGPQLVPLVVAVADRLGRFAARPEYRTLRAEDKREVIDFRHSLYEMRHNKNGVPVARLRQGVEGFSKFLDAMQAINHREVLIVHDRQRLTEGLEKLNESVNLAMFDAPTAHGRLGGIVRHLVSVLGRHPDLDEALRRFDPTAIAVESVAAELQRWKTLAETALSVVG
jgi:hypothetical protein